MGSNVVYARKQRELIILFILSSFASQIYGPDTSLTTRRTHLQNTLGHPEEYLAAVEQYGFANKLPAELARQVAEHRAMSLNRLSTYTANLINDDDQPPGSHSE
jgi:putative NADPH-quinone reductase